MLHRLSGTDHEWGVAVGSFVVKFIWNIDQKRSQKFSTGRGKKPINNIATMEDSADSMRSSGVGMGL